MKKLFAALISMLLLAVLPFGAMAGIEDGVVANSATTADDIVSFTIYTNTAEEANDDNITVTATNNADTTETAITYIYDIPNERNSVTARFIAADLGITAAGEYNISIDIVGDDGTTSLLSEDVMVTVVEADPEEALEDEVIRNLNIEDDDLTFGDEVEFDIEFEVEDDVVVEDVYFEVALYQNGEKVEGWIESEDEFRLDDDGEEEYTHDDLRKPLMIPSDDEIDEGIVTLMVRAYGDYGIYSEHLLDTHEETFEVERLDDHILIDNVVLEQEGKVLYATVTVENDGEENQYGVQLRVQIPELGINEVSRAVPVYEDDEAWLHLPILLTGATAGDYDVRLTVSNNDVSAMETVEDFGIDGIVPTDGGEATARLIIGVDQLNKQVSEQGAVYILTFTNNDVSARTLEVEVAGANWARTSVNPGTVYVTSQGSEVVSVFLAPNEEAQGMQQFTVFIKEDGQIIKSLGMTAQITGAAADDGIGGYESLINSGLKWIAAILIIVLIVLFVVWSWRREESRSEVY